MNSFNRDFVKPQQRVNNRIIIERKSPLHLAKIYMAAEKEAVLNLGNNDDSSIIKVLCEWISDGCTTKITL